MATQNRVAFSVLVLALFACIQITFIAPVIAAPMRVAFLGLRLQNDNEKLEPTTDAERKRVAMVEQQFTAALASSGAYTVTPLTDEVRKGLAAGQPVGSCGGCEAQ